MAKRSTNPPVEEANVTAFPKGSKVKFNYLKNNDFCTHLSTGVIGGPTINGLIDMNFFVDRATIPQIMEHDLETDGTLSEGKELARKDGHVREVLVGILMDINTASSLYEWLGKHITKLRSQLDTIEAQENK